MFVVVIGVLLLLGAVALAALLATRPVVDDAAISEAAPWLTGQLLAWGVCGLLALLGLVLLLVGGALRSLAGGPSVAVTTPALRSDGELSAPARRPEGARPEHGPEPHPHPEPRPDPRPEPRPEPGEPPHRRSFTRPAEAPPVRRDADYTAPLPPAPPPGEPPLGEEPLFEPRREPRA
jgi:hypothetical protein